jgi:hypothetical protein
LYFSSSIIFRRMIRARAYKNNSGNDECNEQFLHEG